MDLQSMINGASFFANASLTAGKTPTLQNLLQTKQTRLQPDQIKSVLSAGNDEVRRTLASGILKNLEVNAQFGLLTDIRSTLGAIGERLNLLSLQTDSLEPSRFSAVTQSIQDISTSNIPGNVTVARSVSSLPLSSDTDINPNALVRNLNINTAISSGNFSINGVNISVDKDSDTLNDVINRINTSGAGVSAALINANKRLEIVGPQSPIVLADGSSNFLSALKVDTAPQTAGTVASILGGIVNLSADPGKKTGLLGGQIIDVSNDPGVKTELVSDDFAKNYFQKNKNYNIYDITSITTSSGTFGDATTPFADFVDLTGVSSTASIDTSGYTSDTEATFETLQLIVDEINTASGTFGAGIQADLVSDATRFNIRIQDLNDPYGNITIQTQAGNNTGISKNIRFGAGTAQDADPGTPTSTGVNSIIGSPPTTDFGSLQLTGSGTANVDFLIGGVSPTNGYLQGYTGGPAQFIADRINAVTKSGGSNPIDIIASVDPSGRILLQRESTGALNLTVNTVVANNDGYAGNDSPIGFSSGTTVNNGTDPTTDFGLLNINGQSINLGVQTNNFITTNYGTAANYIKSQINGATALTNVTASVVGSQVKLDQNSIGAANGIDIQVVLTDSDSQAINDSSTGFGTTSPPIYGTDTSVQSTTDLGVSDFNNNLSALSGKLGLNVPGAAPFQFLINGVSIGTITGSDTLQGAIDKVNAATATTGVVASYDVPSNKLLLTATTQGPAPIEVQDIVGNFLEAFRIPQTVSAPSANSSSGLNLNVNANEIKIDLNAKISDLNVVNPITASGSFTIDPVDTVGFSSVAVNFDPFTDSINDLITNINAQKAISGVEVSYDFTNDALKFSTIDGPPGNNATFQLNALGGSSGEQLLQELKLPIGVNAAVTNTPGQKAKLTGGSLIALNGQTDVAAQVLGTAVVGLSGDPGQAPVLDGSNISIGKNSTRDFGDIGINGVTINIGNYTSSNNGSAAVRSQETVDFIVGKITAAAVPGITATRVDDLVNSRSFIRLTGSAASNDKVEITDQLYTDPLVKNQSPGFLKGQIDTGRSPTTDFGTITINGTPVNLGVISNSSPEAADPAQYVVDTINIFTPYTNVNASVNAGKIQLTSTNPGAGAGRDINIGTITNDSDSYAPNDFDLGFSTFIGNNPGQDAKTDFGKIDIKGPDALGGPDKTVSITLGTVLNRENTSGSALNFIVNKINTDASANNLEVQAFAENGKLVLRSLYAQADTIQVTSFTADTDGNGGNNAVGGVGFTGIETNTGVNADPDFNLASTASIGQSDLDLTLDRIAGKIGLNPVGNIIDFSVNGINFNRDVTTTTLRNLLNDVSNDLGAGVAAVFDPASKKIKINNDVPSPTLTFGDNTGDFTVAAKLVFKEPFTVINSPQELGRDPATITTTTEIQGSGGNLEGTAGKFLLTNIGASAGGLNLPTPLTSGTFSINDKAIAIDVEHDNLNDLLNKINNSGAGVTAALVGGKLELESPGKIKLGGADDTSNLIQALGLENAGGGTFASRAGRRGVTLDSGDTTDLGSVDINGQTINLGTVSNSLGAQGAAQLAADRINAETGNTGVQASVDDKNRIQLEQTTPGSALTVRNVTNLTNSGLFAGDGEAGEQFKTKSGVTLVPDDFDQGEPSEEVRKVASDVRSFVNELNTAAALVREGHQQGLQEVDGALKRLKLDDLGVSLNEQGQLTIDEEKLTRQLQNTPDAVSAAFQEAKTAVNEPVQAIGERLKRLPNLVSGAREFAQNAASEIGIQGQSEQARYQMDQLTKAQSALLNQTQQLREGLSLKKPQDKNALNIKPFQRIQEGGSALNQEKQAEQRSALNVLRSSHPRERFAQSENSVLGFNSQE